MPAGMKPMENEEGNALEPGADKSKDGKDRRDHMPGEDVSPPRLCFHWSNYFSFFLATQRQNYVAVFSGRGILVRVLPPCLESHFSVVLSSSSASS